MEALMKTGNESRNKAIAGCTNGCSASTQPHGPGLKGVSWRALFSAFGAAATRVHRYRDLHTRSLHNALCANDRQYRESRRCSHE